MTHRISAASPAKSMPLRIWMRGLAALLTLVGMPLCHADSCHTPPSSQIAVVQYLPDFLSERVDVAHEGLLAWRQWSGTEGLCVYMDYPISQRLGPSQVRLLQEQMAALHRQSARELQPARRISLDPSIYKHLPLLDLAPLSPSLGLPSGSFACGGRRTTAQQYFWRFAERDLSFAARLGPKSCLQNTDFAGAGSAIIVAPTLALTAAHTLTKDGATTQCRYRVIPAGGRYDQGAAQPFGAVDISQIALGRRANYWMHYTANELTEAQLHPYVAADHAYLRLAPNKLGQSKFMWPALIFGAPAQINPVYKTGYASEALARALRPAGASLSADGLDACARSTKLSAYSMMSFLGDSGAPIWQHPDQQAQGWLSVISIVSVSERTHESAPYTYGPRFTLALYRQILAYLAQVDH